MTTLTIELPETLVKEIEARGISQERLENLVTYLVKAYFDESDKISSDDEAPLTSARSGWSDAEQFARHVIANNRELFEELARL